MENTNKQTEQQPDICFAGIENEQETQIANDGISATYAEDSGIMPLALVRETIVFTATYTIDPVTSAKSYTVDAGQTNEFKDYFDQSKRNPVVVQCTLAGATASSEQEIFFLNKTYQKGIQHDMEFVSFKPGEINKLVLRMIKSTAGVWGSSISAISHTYPFNAEYKYDRYYNPASTFDMNDFTESGGFVAEASEGSTGVNIPAGFTEFYGYILKNNGGVKKCCTQVLTDRILLKTMMRSSVPDAAYKNRVWTDWKEIGNGTSVYVVTEYPADLSTYADGSIFIKQQA